jgi:hypothetical protein
MGSAVWQDRDSDSANGSPPEAFGGLPLDLDSLSGYKLTKPLFYLCLCLFVDNQEALLCFVKISSKKAESIYFVSFKDPVIQGSQNISLFAGAVISVPESLPHVFVKRKNG